MLCIFYLPQVLNVKQTHHKFDLVLLKKVKP